MPIIDPLNRQLGSCNPTSKDRSKLVGKSITTSVPSIAVRFHSGDEELSLYPSTDDEDEGGKDDILSRSTSGTTTSFTPPSNPSPSVLSRDPSPMKEYLKGLGKRSSSVDAGMMDAGSSGSDTWRIFHELKGKITKTVEEKLTEIKSERRSVTPLFSGKSSTKPGRLRAGGNSQDNSSISDSEDISESSNKDDTKMLPAVDSIDPLPNTSTVSATATETEETKPIKLGEDINDEIPTSSFDDNTIKEGPEEISVAKVKVKKGKKTHGLRFRKGGHVAMSSLQVDDEESDYDKMIEDDIESGVEASEETKFVSADSYDDIPTTDYRTPHIHRADSAFTATRRKSSVRPSDTATSSTISGVRLTVRTYRYVIISIVLFILLLIFPFPTYLKGVATGIMLALVYHFIIGMTSWYIPYEAPSSSFQVPNYLEMPILEVPLEDNFLAVTRCGGWMNELPDTYDPDTYHINNTQTVYVRLEGSTLRLSHTKSKIPKRALWNERKLKLKFIHQRIYNISGCEIKLLPEGITRKRRWSKKYPICIILKKEAKQKEADIEGHFLSDSNQEQEGLLPYPTQEEVTILTPKGSTFVLPPAQEPPSMSLNETESMESFQNTEEADTVTDEVDIDEDIQDMINEDSFCVIEKPLSAESCLYLFSRTDREKEDWYRRFVAAIKCKAEPSNKDDDKEHDMKRRVSIGGVALKQTPMHYSFDDSNFNNVEFIAESALRNADMDYIAFMNKFHVQINRKGKQEEKMATNFKLNREVDCDVMWINSLIGRVVYDFLQNPCILEKVTEKIQKKLSTIKLPYVVEEFILTNVELGKDIPMIHRASRPILDDHGLWVDLDVTYEGNAVLTVETKINLMKLKKETSLPSSSLSVGLDPAAEEIPTEEENTPEKRAVKCKSPIYDSSVEDSAESSPTETDEEDRNTSSDELNKPSSSAQSDTVSIGESSSLEKKPKPVAAGKGVVKMMNKFVSSQFFQSATENKFIKRAMEGVSNTRLVLTVEIKACTGQLALNIPPPPSDRLWYGFRGNPRLWISVKPKFGQRAVNISYITSWLEKKLILEFQKKLVLPNMDDLVILPMQTQLPE